MFGLGLWEIVVIAIVALLVLGPERLPQAARQIGRSLRELRRAASDLQGSLEEAAYLEEDDKRIWDAPKHMPKLEQPSGIEAQAPDTASADTAAQKHTDKKA